MYAQNQRQTLGHGFQGFDRGLLPSTRAVVPVTLVLWYSRMVSDFPFYYYRKYKCLFSRQGLFTVHKTQTDRQTSSSLLLHILNIFPVAWLAPGPSHDERLLLDWNDGLKESYFLVLTHSLFILSSDLMTCNLLLE